MTKPIPSLISILNISFSGPYIVFIDMVLISIHFNFNMVLIQNTKRNLKRILNKKKNKHEKHHKNYIHSNFAWFISDKVKLHPGDTILMLLMEMMFILLLFQKTEDGKDVDLIHARVWMGDKGCVLFFFFDFCAVFIFFHDWSIKVVGSISLFLRF